MSLSCRKRSLFQLLVLPAGFYSRILIRISKKVSSLTSSPVFFSFTSLVFVYYVIFVSNALNNSVIPGDTPVTFSSFRLFALAVSHNKLNLSLADLWDFT